MLYFEKKQCTKIRWNRYLNGIATAENFWYFLKDLLYTFLNFMIVEQKCLKLKDSRGWLRIPVQILQLLCCKSIPSVESAPSADLPILSVPISQCPSQVQS